MSELPATLSTTIVYFSRDKKYDKEKPYTTSFPVDNIPGAKVDNHEFEHVPVIVRNMRNSLSPQLDLNGFCFVEWPTNLKLKEFDSREIVIKIYFAELAEMFKKYFPRYRKVSFFDHAVRHRSSHYPTNKGTVVSASQPFRFAHVDFTEHGALLKLGSALPGDPATHLKDSREGKCDILNIWRLLNSKPTRDWPLGWCDYSSIDLEHDLIANDVVYPKGLGESIFLRSNPAHQWWYLGGQRPNEIAIFRNVCIGDSSLPQGFHCAFFNPTADHSDELRSSLEVRVAAWY